MSVTKILLAAFLGLAAGCESPDCDMFDCGTCGGPCCIVGLSFDMSADELSTKFMETVSSPSMPGNYQVKDVHCVGSKDPETAWTWDPAMNPMAPMFPVSSVEPAEKASCVALMSADSGGDAFGGHVFTDDVNFVITTEGGKTIMKASSHSVAATPIFRCDWGQNWHNIKQVLTALDVPYKEVSRIGCSTPRPAGAMAPMPVAKMTLEKNAKSLHGKTQVPPTVVLVGLLGVLAVLGYVMKRDRESQPAQQLA